MDWLKSRASGQRTAGYSNQPPKHKDGLMLAKPLQDDHLARLLHGLVADGLQPDAAPQADEAPSEPASVPSPDADTTAAHDDSPSGPGREPDEHSTPPDPHTARAPDATTTANPTDTAAEEAAVPATMPDTVGQWLLAGIAQTPFALRHEDQSLLVDPAKGTWHGGKQLKPLIPLLQLAPDAARTPDRQELAVLDGAGQPIDRLLWLAALTATPGRLSTRHDSVTTFHLDRWPQIEREFPRHFRIATAMMKQPGSLGELASMANTAEADVADFINAYTALGHVVASDQDDAVEQSARPRLRKLFARGANR